MWAIVGLGNPGMRYAETRHNVGFKFIKKVARDWQVKLKKKKYLAKTVELERENDRIILAMPQTYMNKSGLAVKQILEGTRIKPEQLIVAYDDLDIPLGEIRIRKEGSPGTHNGMVSIVQEIETTKFSRIRIGIGWLSSNQDTTDYVLSPFEKREKACLEKSLKSAREALEMILAGQIDKAMNTYNQKAKVL